MNFRALDFFAGSGLVRVGLEPDFDTLWANDVCPKKAAVYNANHPTNEIDLRSIKDVHGSSLPKVDLAWGSFPCQDLSLAGDLGGMKKGTRSGLFWEWLRVLDEMEAAGRRVPVLLAENVVGFLIADQSKHFVRAYKALRKRRYRVGAVVVDARMFLPQSRPRTFVIAVSDEVSLEGLVAPGPKAPFHTEAIRRAANAVNDRDWVWWSLPVPTKAPKHFRDVCERDADYDNEEKTRQLRAMLSPVNRQKLEAPVRAKRFFAGTGYRRIRPNDKGTKVQRLEIRFDGIAGCLRTPGGGSSRQVVVVVDKGKVRTRLMTIRECARLMGAPDTYEIPGSYNDGYRAMGDAVAVPVTRWIASNLLGPLAQRYKHAPQREASPGASSSAA